MQTFINSIITAAFFLTVTLGSAWAGPPANCPVTGKPINTGSYTVSNGRRVDFYSTARPAAFKKNPENYLIKIEREVVELKKQPAQAAAPGKE